MAKGLRRIAGVRLAIAIQVFTTLLILVVGYFVIERNLRELTLSPRPVSPYQIKMVLLEIRTEVLVVALVAFLSGLALTFTIRQELRSAMEQVKRISKGVVEPSLPGDLSQEFVPLNRAIRELAESVGKFLRTSVTDAIILFREDLTIHSLNPRAELLLGYRSEEVSGKPLGILFPEHAENRELHQWLREMGKDDLGNRPSMGAILTKAGEWIPLRLAVFKLGAEQDHLGGIVAGVFDESEWERIRAEFDRAERLSNLGLLISGLAHEIKNPLGSIQGLVQLLLEEFPPQHPRRKYLETIVEEVARLDGIMKRLLDISSPARWRRETVDLAGLLRQVGTLMEGEALKRGVRLEALGTPQELYTEGDQERLRQAFINVMKNAVEATERGGTVRYGAEKGSAWSALWVENPARELSSGRRAQEGLADSVGKEQGSGLGLLITQQILQYHGGTLEMDRTPEGHMLVRMRFPAAKTVSTKTGVFSHG